MPRTRLSREVIGKIKFLRTSGYSITAIMEELFLPRTTVWHHIKDLSIPIEYTKDLRSRQGGSKVRSEKAWGIADTETNQILSDPTKSYWASILAMLYWAEGNKREFTFTNTDPEMVRLTIGILKKLFGVQSKDLRVTVRYFTGMEEAVCRNYWSEITNVPKENLKMYFNDGGKVGRTPFGICRLRLGKSGPIFKVIQCLIKKVPNNLSP